MLAAALAALVAASTASIASSASAFTYEPALCESGSFDGLATLVRTPDVTLEPGENVTTRAVATNQAGAVVAVGHWFHKKAGDPDWLTANPITGKGQIPAQGLPMLTWRGEPIKVYLETWVPTVVGEIQIPVRAADGGEWCIPGR